MTESTAAGVLIVTAPLVWWLASRRRQVRIARLSLGFIALQLAAGLTVLAAQAAGWGIVGTAQRIYEIGISLWLGSLVMWLPMERRAQQYSAKESTLDLDPGQV